MLVYDIEIVKAVPPKYGEPKEPGIQYCDGWEDFANMGISVVGIYDYNADTYRIFCEDNREELQMLFARHNICVSFGGIKFDNNVLHAAWGIEIDRNKCYDILREIWVSMGLDPTRFVSKTHGGLSLNAIAIANGLTGKTGNGAYAPHLWQQGKIGSVIDYCLQDVRATKGLLDKILRLGQLKDPRFPNARPIKLSVFNLAQRATASELEQGDCLHD